MRKSIIVSLAIVAVLGVAAYAASPYWTLHQIRSAAASGEGERVAAYVDFPSLRESFKVQLAQALSRRRESRTSDPPSAMGQALAATMVNGLVDAMITPDAVAAMIRSGKTPRSIVTTKPTSNRADAGDRKEPKIRHSFEGLNTFQATLVDPDTEQMLLTAVLTRDGLFEWRLTAVRLPG